MNEFDKSVDLVSATPQISSRRTLCFVLLGFLHHHAAAATTSELLGYFDAFFGTILKAMETSPFQF